MIKKNKSLRPILSVLYSISGVGDFFDKDLEIRQTTRIRQIHGRLKIFKGTVRVISSEPPSLIHPLNLKLIKDVGHIPVDLQKLF